MNMLGLLCPKVTITNQIPLNCPKINVKITKTKLKIKIKTES
jgi:hypothetical protein